MPRPLRLLHTSDVHIGNGIRCRDDGPWPEQAVAEFARVLRLIDAHAADAVLISGDLFDHNRIAAELAALVAGLLERARVPVVILPGNHDPHTADSVYVRHRFPDNVRILRDASGEVVVLEELGLQVWGRAHTDYFDFAPAGVAPRWDENPRRNPWRVALAHGLYVRSDYETRLSYRITDAELDALRAHYVGLGHLEHHEPVGPAGANAYYAGAPERSGGATLVDLGSARTSVRQVAY